jgi:dolichol-phosphate mannosyltransferase
MHVSMVIPVHDEQGNIGRLIEEIFQVIPAHILHEVLIVDDRSSDKSYDEASALVGRYPSLRCLRLEQNSGKSAACRTGIEAAEGPIIACLDGDGQNDPRDILRMMEQLSPAGSNGATFITGIQAQRETSKSASHLKKAVMWLQRKLFKVDLPSDLCGPQLFWKEAYMRLPYFRRQHCYLPLLFATDGHQIGQVTLALRQRLAGISKQANTPSIWTVLQDLIGLYWLRLHSKTPNIIEDTGRTGRVYTFSARRRKRASERNVF